MEDDKEIFEVAETYPETVRQFLLNSTQDRGEALIKKAETLDRYFAVDQDGKPMLHHIMNSPDLTSEPSKETPECEAFKHEVMDLFRAIVTEQASLEASSAYGVTAAEAEMAANRRVRRRMNSSGSSASAACSVDQDVVDADGVEEGCLAWVIGAKLDNATQGVPVLSLGDALVSRLLAGSRWRHVFSTSRSSQEPTSNHTHFSSDLDCATPEDLRSQMQEVDKLRQTMNVPLVVYFVFSNTGANCEDNPATGKNMNRCNIDIAHAFTTAARESGWLRDCSVRFVIVSTFHCSPERATYNDKLRVRPVAEQCGGPDSDEFKQASSAASACAGLIEYTSSKFAQNALFAAALTSTPALQKELQGQAQFVEQLHAKINSCPSEDYARFNQWVMNECSDDIHELERYVDRFYEDTAGHAAVVRNPELALRMAVVKIPFALTTMIATRKARVSVCTNVKSLNDSWVRTKGRLGWAISPDCGAAWMEAAAVRMSAESSALREFALQARCGDHRPAADTCNGLEAVPDLLPLVRELDPNGSGRITSSAFESFLRQLGCDEATCREMVQASCCEKKGECVNYTKWLDCLFRAADGRKR